MAITVFEAAVVHTMNPANPRATHVAVADDGSILGVGNLDDVAAAKGELYAVLRKNATAVVNLDDVHARVQASRHGGPRVTFGRQPGADLRLESLENRFLPGAALVVRHGDRTLRLQLALGGAHAAFNALGALATVLAA